MISSKAGTSLERMVESGLRSALREGPGDSVAVERCGVFQPQGDAQLVLMMIASHGFRMVLALSFACDQPTRALLARVGRMAEGDDSVQAFRDAISETGNMCCGTLNREIGRFYRHTGMSTPHIIDSRSGPHVDHLAHQLLSHFRVAIGGGAYVRASLSVHAHEPMDFDWAPEAEPETTGELEFF